MSGDAAHPAFGHRVHGAPGFCGRDDGGFTLLELIGVVVIIVMMTALVVPALTSMNRATGINEAIYDIAGTLEQARSYAMANNTYVYVGIAETNVTLPRDGAQTAGVGRVCLATVATRDGAAGYSSGNLQNWAASYPAFMQDLAPVGKPLVIENLHIADLGAPPASGGLARPTLTAATGLSYSAGNALFVSATPFAYPVGSGFGGGQYNFTKVLQYDPQGAVCLQGTSSPAAISHWIEIGLQQANGGSVPALPSPVVTGNIAALQIDGVTGAVRIYRP